MKLLSRYIRTNISSTIFFVTLILAGLQLFISLATEFEEIGQGNYGLVQILHYVILTLPYRLYLLFPLAGLIGAVIGLGLLSSRSELIVMQTSSVSVGRIIRSVLATAVLLILVAIFVGEVLGPHLRHQAETQKSIAKTGGQAVHTHQGTWLRDGDNFIHIQSILPGKHLRGITRYQFDKEHHLLSASEAEYADYKDKHWQLHNVKESKISTERVTATQRKIVLWNTSVNPNLLSLSNVSSDEISLPKLHAYIKYRKQHGLSVNSYALVFWKRIFLPFTSAVMIFLAVPFVFGPLRNVTMGMRIMAGTIVGFCFYISNEFFGPMSLVFHFPPIIAAVLPALVFGSAAYLMLVMR